MRRKNLPTRSSDDPNVHAMLLSREVQLDDLVNGLRSMGVIGGSELSHRLPDRTTFLGAFAFRLDACLRERPPNWATACQPGWLNPITARLVLANFAAHIPSPPTLDGGGMPTLGTVLLPIVERATHLWLQRPFEGPRLDVIHISSVEECRKAAQVLQSYVEEWRTQFFPSPTVGQPPAPAAVYFDAVLRAAGRTALYLGGVRLDGSRQTTNSPIADKAGESAAATVHRLSALAPDWAKNMLKLILRVYVAATSQEQVDAARARLGRPAPTR
jgi:hypothetical protein